MEKCEVCVIGFGIIADRLRGPLDNTNLIKFYEDGINSLCFMPQHHFNYCSECGHKIDWRKIDGKV